MQLIYFVFAIVVFFFFGINILKLLYLILKYLVYYICDIFGCQFQNHALAYRVPLVPFWLPIFTFTLVGVILIPEPNYKLLSFVFIISFLYVCIYIVAMFQRYKKNIKQYDEIAQKNLDFIKLSIVPVSGLVTLVGFGLTATGATLDTPYNMSLMMYRVITYFVTSALELLPSDYIQSYIEILSMSIFIIISLFIISLPNLITGYILIGIFYYIARNRDDYRELWASVSIRKMINKEDTKIGELMVKKPLNKDRITVRTFFKTRYVYYETGKVNNIYKKYNASKRVCIGKECADNPEMMIPNMNFRRLFPELMISDEVERIVRRN